MIEITLKTPGLRRIGRIHLPAVPSAGMLIHISGAARKSGIRYRVEETIFRFEDDGSFIATAVECVVSVVEKVTK